MAFNKLNIETTRRLSTGLLAINGALLLTALNIIGSAVVADQADYAKAISEPVPLLLSSSLAAGLAFLFAEMAGRRETPDEGHPHSKRNYLESAFTILVVSGLLPALWGGTQIVFAITPSN